MIEPRPRVSVGLPVYNGENYIGDALRSLQAQTFGDLEIIVSDNASTDDTEKIVRDLASDDPRIRYLRREDNVGANRNFNRTFFFARGEYFKWAAHDDVVAPEFLERCVEALDADPALALVHTRTSYIGETGDPLRQLAHGYLAADGFIERLPLDDSVADALASSDPATRFDAVVNRMSVFYDVFGLGRTEAFRNTLLLRQYYGADKVFLAEMAVQGPIVRLPDVLFRRRCHATTSTRTEDLADRARWSDPTLRLTYHPVQMLAGFAQVVRTADLSPGDRRRCLVALGRKARSPLKLLRGL